MTKTQIAILDLVKKQKELILTGNREYYEILEFSSNEWILIFGDTMINQETGRNIVTEHKALEIIMKFYIDKFITFYPKHSTTVTDEEILKYMKEHWYS